MTAHVLVERFPDAAEGELTRRRAVLVCESGLAEVARALSLGDAILLGKGEERSGGREKPRLLSSALEACFGAVLRDVGPEQAFAVARATAAMRRTKTIGNCPSYAPPLANARERVQIRE